MRLTTNPINKNYCAYETLQHDRLPEKLRRSPEFAQTAFPSQKAVRTTSSPNAASPHTETPLTPDPSPPITLAVALTN